MWYTFCAKPMILIDRIVTLRSRSPCGERGLKSFTLCRQDPCFLSLPVRGAWIEMSRGRQCRAPCGSLPVRGAWIEMLTRRGQLHHSSRRSPCGERGLKCRRTPARRTRNACRSPCGERGLKSRWRVNARPAVGRSPCGERGLKCARTRPSRTSATVAPRAGSVD